jgi:hypothetical protein
MIPLFAQMPSAPPDDHSLVAFVLLTVIFLVLVAIILQVVQSYETKLILLGLVCAVTATGYVSLVPAAGMLAPVLMKIGVLLVLGGLACSLMTYLRGGPPPQSAGR